MIAILERLYSDLTDHERKTERELNAQSLPTGKYILDENNVAVAAPLGTWIVWYERESKKQDSRRIVKQEAVGPYWVSTVFLGLDHSFGFLEGEPRALFETMIFLAEGREKKKHGAWRGLYQERYPTWERALAGHVEIVERVKLGELPERDDE